MMPCCLDAGVTSAGFDDHPERALLDRLEEYFDAVPRHGARVEDYGPITLFVREGQGWPFYARPAREWSGPLEVTDVQKVRARQRGWGSRKVSNGSPRRRPRCGQQSRPRDSWSTNIR